MHTDPHLTGSAAHSHIGQPPVPQRHWACHCDSRVLKNRGVQGQSLHILERSRHFPVAVASNMAHPLVQMWQYDRPTWYTDAGSTISPLYLSAQCRPILLAEDRHNIFTPNSTVLPLCPSLAVHGTSKSRRARWSTTSHQGPSQRSPTPCITAVV